MSIAQPAESSKSTFTLRSKPIVSRPELQDTSPEGIYTAWKQTPSPELGAQLLESLKPHLEQSTRKWTGDANPVALGRARSLTIQALPRFEPGRASLATFIDRQLQPLSRWSARKNLGVKVQTGLVQERRYVGEIEKQMEDELGRSPSYEEIADRSGIDIKRLQRIRAMKMPTVGESAQEGDEGSQMYAEDQAVEGPEDLWQKTVYHSLSPTDQVVFQHTIGLYGAKILPNAIIASRLRISPGAVSQRKARIQKTLDSQNQSF